MRATREATLASWASWASRAPAPSGGVVVLEDPVLRGLRSRRSREATRQGLRAFACELTLPRGFELRDGDCAVLPWHGELDRSAAVSMGRHVERSLPRCCAAHPRHEGRFLAARHRDSIVRAPIAPGLAGPER